MDGEDSKQRLNLQTLNCECLSFELTMCLLFNYESSELNLVSYLFFVPQNTDNNIFSSYLCWTQSKLQRIFWKFAETDAANLTKTVELFI